MPWSREKQAIALSAVVAMAFPILVSSAVKTPNLAGGWRFEEGTGVAAADFSGNGKDGALTNTPGWTTGKFSRAISLNGTNQYVLVPGGTSLQFTGDMTLSVWVKFNDVLGPKQSVVGNKQFGGYGIRLNDDAVGSRRVDFTIDDGDAGVTSYKTYSTTLVSNGIWYHFLGVVEGPEIRLYVDGKVESSSATINMADSDYDFFIGGDPTGAAPPGTLSYPCNCAIDEVRVYNRALSTAEIRGLMLGYEPGEF